MMRSVLIHLHPDKMTRSALDPKLGEVRKCQSVNLRSRSAYFYRMADPMTLLTLARDNKVDTIETAIRGGINPNTGNQVRNHIIDMPYH